jgi:hypothetical protein
MKKRKRRRQTKQKIHKIIPPQGPDPWQRQAFAAGARSVRDELTLAGAQNFLQVMLNDHVANGGSGDDLCALIIATLNSTKKLREVLKQRNTTQWPMT